MYEVELKAPADHAAVRSALADRELTVSGPVAQSDRYYEAPHRSFAETDEALRLRREGPVEKPVEDVETAVEAAIDETTATLTYKGPLEDVDSKTRKEIETSVGDAGATDALLESLGYRSVAAVRKLRETAQIEGYHVTLDRVAGLGSYVEIEQQTERSQIAAVSDGARTVLQELGVDPAKTTQTSYLEQLIDKKIQSDNP